MPYSVPSMETSAKRELLGPILGNENPSFAFVAVERKTALTGNLLTLGVALRKLIDVASGRHGTGHHLDSDAGPLGNV